MGYLKGKKSLDWGSQKAGKWWAKQQELAEQAARQWNLPGAKPPKPPADAPTSTPRPKTPDVDPANPARVETDVPAPHPKTPDVDPTTPPRVETDVPAPKNADGTADISNAKSEPASARDSSVQDSGRIESDQLSDRQIKNELDHIKNNPNIVEGTPPNRKAKIGEHEWQEQPGGGWCRHSNGQVCVPGNQVGTQPTSSTTTSSGQPIWSSTKKKSSVQNAFGHWEKHKSEFPHLQNAKQYVEQAQDFLNNPPPGALQKTRPNGEIVIFDPNTDTFAVYLNNGTPKTMFKPDPNKHGLPSNLDYFNAQ